MPTQAEQKLIDDALAKQKAQLDKEREAAVEAARKEAAAEAASSSSTPTAPAEAETSDYELLAGTYTGTAKPGQTPPEYVRGDKVPLTKERADQLIAAGAVKDPNASDDSGAKPGDQTKPPASPRS